jgi:hypothetical protein
MPRILTIVASLAACSVPQPQATVQQASLSVPVYQWPFRQERPEGDHPAHGEGSGESASVVGIAASGTFTNVAAQQVTFSNDFTLISGGPFYAGHEQFSKGSPRSNFTLRVLPDEPTKFFRAAIPRRTVGTRTGR